MSSIILAIGIMVFFSHFLSMQFSRTNIPDVLVLMLVGILLGPVLGMVAPDDFGKVGPVIATIALVVILFEGGTSLRLEVLGKSLKTTGVLSLSCFLLTAAIVAGTAVGLLQLQWLPAIMLGIILAGTSSAVVIPLVNALNLDQKSGTVLVLESALTDVLCIVGVFALLQIFTQGEVTPGHLIGSVLAALAFAAVIGIVGGIGWMLVLGKVRDFPNTISSTLAYVFIVYGVTEFLGFSGAIAALSLGITLTNFDKHGARYFKTLSSQKIVPLNEMDMVFYKEAVFLLKTYFFVYLGISIHFYSRELALAAAAMVVLVFAMRLVLTRQVYRHQDFALRDTAITSMMVPKGLAAAVLANLPLQSGVPGAEIIRDTTYMVVLLSIILCALLVSLYPLKPVRKLYARMLGKPLE